LIAAHKSVRMARQIWAVPVLLSFVLGACTGLPAPGSGATALQPPAGCRSADDDSGSVAAAFASNVGAIRRLPAVANNAQLSAYADDEAATVCYIDGEIPKAPPPPSSGSIPPSFDRAVVVVVGDEGYFIAAGYQQGLSIQAP
jgi:hypothetical protein